MTQENKKSVKPEITMNTTDKLFFALARRDVDTKSYVYALVINNSNVGKDAAPSYPAETKTEISAFRSASRADMYYETAKLVMEQQQTGVLKQLYDTFRNWFEPQISAFNKMAADFKTKTK